MPDETRPARALLRAKFDLFDRDGDGYITLEEFETVTKSLGIERRRFESRIALWRHDTNRDNRISFEEFVAAFGRA